MDVVKGLLLLARAYAREMEPSIGAVSVQQVTI
jgi:hypothetical protein